MAIFSRSDWTTHLPIAKAVNDCDKEALQQKEYRRAPSSHLLWLHGALFSGRALVKKRLWRALYLEGVEEHLIVHLDQPGDARHFRIGHGVEYDIVHAKQRHQHQRGLQQLSAMIQQMLENENNEAL